MSVQLAKDPYLFDPAFERAILTLCAQSKRFWGRCGAHLDPECMASPFAKLVHQTCMLIAREVGHGPTSLLITVQRLRRLMLDGKVTLEHVNAINDMFDDAVDAGLPDEDEAADVILPILRRRMQQQAIIQSHDVFAKQGDFEGIIGQLQRASRLGEIDNTIGTILGPDGFDEIDRASALSRLPTGILELDMQMEDPLHRGGLGVVLGGSGDGKSMFLVHQAASCVRDEKLFVGMATLELPKNVQLARLYANLTGMPTNQILRNMADRAEAKRRAAYMAPAIGACIVEEFAPHATTVDDLADWCDRVAEEFGRPFDALVVDYGDKLYDPRIKGDNEYLAMRYVYEGLRRDIAVKRNMWVWTGSQAGRPSKEQGKRLELHHVSDSMHKVRVADIVLTLNAKEDGAQMLYFVAKNRLGKSRFQVGPMPTDFERARMSPFAREFVQWGFV